MTVTVSRVLQPVGPLPPSVYWRRRAVTAVAGLVAVVGVSTSLAGGGADEPSGQAPVPTSTGSSPAAAPSATAPTGTGGSSADGPTAASDGPAEPSPAGTTEPAERSTTEPTPNEPTPTATTTTTAPDPAGCPDADLGVVAEVEQPAYAVGEQPVFRLVVTNTGQQVCTRDLDASLQQVLVFGADGASRLWSSSDCFPGGSDEFATLQPGEQRVYSVQWSGTTSEPGCTAPRVPVPAGQYSAVVTLGELTSQPVPFTLS